MARFQRPEGTIKNYSDLKVGDHIFHVYGIWPPFFGGEHIVTKAPDTFSRHRGYGEIHSMSAESIVFDVKYGNGGNSYMNFATDGNLNPGHSHNDNYWFRSEQAARDAVTFLRSQWEADPELIAAEQERRARDWADYDGDDYSDSVEESELAS